MFTDNDLILALHDGAVVAERACRDSGLAAVLHSMADSLAASSAARYRDADHRLDEIREISDFGSRGA
jgi:hypothetical protein